MPSPAESEKTYDLVVIGGGPAGYVAAIRAAQLGMTAACIEKDSTYGGTCLNVGCIPSKALLDSSERYHEVKENYSKHGIKVSGVELDLAQMMKRKDEVVKGLTTGIGGLLKKNKVDALNGIGKILSPEGNYHRVEVSGKNGKKIVRSPKVLIATGSAPAELPFLKFDGKRILSSTEALSLSEVPKHLVVIGAGVIGLEMASVWRRLGSEVTVVEFMDRIVPPSDAEMAKLLQRSLEKLGIEFQLASKCLGAKVSGKAVSVEVESLSSGEKNKIDCDYVLVATGRKPYTDKLGLEELKVSLDKQGRIDVDATFQSNVAGVYAIGDVIAGPMLAHKAEEDGIAAVEIMAGLAGHVNYDLVPSIVYTWPELAWVGKNEEELKAAGVSYRSGSFPFAANGRAKAIDQVEGKVKILADAHTDTVLGVHIFGPQAGDLVAETVAVMEFGGSAEDIARTCHAHPTLSEVVKEAALAVDKRQIHL